MGAGAAQGQVRKNEARAVPKAAARSACECGPELPELRKSIMRGNLRRQYRVAGRVAWAEGGEAHFRTKVRYDSLDFGDQICYVEVPRKIDPSKAVVQFFVLYGGGDDVLAAGGAHMADLGELKWLPLKRGSAAAAGKVRGGALHVRAYVASPADLKQLNAPPAPRAAQRVADPVKWAVATPSLLKQRYESALAVCRVAGGRRRRPKTVPRDAADGAEYGRRPAGDGPERANADVVLLRRCRRLAVAVAAQPQRQRVLRPVGVGVDGRVVERAVAAGVNKNEYQARIAAKSAAERCAVSRRGAAAPRTLERRRLRSRPRRRRRRLRRRRPACSFA